MSDNEDTSPTAHPPVAPTPRLDNSTRALRSTTRTDDSPDDILRTALPSDGMQTPHSKRKRKRRSNSSPPDLARIGLPDDLEPPSPSKPTRMRVRSNSASLLAPSAPGPIHPSSAHPPQTLASPLILPKHILEELEACLSSNSDQLEEGASRGSPLPERSLPADPPPDSPPRLSSDRLRPHALPPSTPTGSGPPQPRVATHDVDGCRPKNGSHAEEGPQDPSSPFAGPSPAVAADPSQVAPLCTPVNHSPPQALATQESTSAPRPERNTETGLLGVVRASQDSNPWDHSRHMFETGLGGTNDDDPFCSPPAPPPDSPAPNVSDDRQSSSDSSDQDYKTIIKAVHVNADAAANLAFEALVPPERGPAEQAKPKPKPKKPKATNLPVQRFRVIPLYEPYIEAKLGNGTYGFVIEALDNKSRIRVALKAIPCGQLQQPSLNQVRREIAITKLVSGDDPNKCHPNIAVFLDSLETPDVCFLMLRLERDGSVESAFTTKDEAGKAQRTPLAETPLIRFARQICEALIYLESIGVVHRDVKPANVVMRGKLGHLLALFMLCDWGVSFAYNDPDADRRRRAEAVGTPQFMAPEVKSVKRLEGSSEGYGFAIDWYSFGVMLLYLATGVLPNGWTPGRRGYEKDLAMLEASSLSVRAKEVILGLLTEDHDSRMSPREALDHPWLANDA